MARPFYILPVHLSTPGRIHKRRLFPTIPLWGPHCEASLSLRTSIELLLPLERHYYLRNPCDSLHPGIKKLREQSPGEDAEESFQEANRVRIGEEADDELQRKGLQTGNSCVAGPAAPFPGQCFFLFLPECALSSYT